MVRDIDRASDAEKLFENLAPPLSPQRRKPPKPITGNRGFPSSAFGGGYDHLVVPPPPALPVPKPRPKGDLESTIFIVTRTDASTVMVQAKYYSRMEGKIIFFSSDDQRLDTTFDEDDVASIL